MSGIGKHKYSTSNNSIWNPDKAICPYCGASDCEADWVDVGLNLSSYQLDAVPVKPVALQPIVEQNVLKLAIRIGVSVMLEPLH